MLTPFVAALILAAQPASAVEPLLEHALHVQGDGFSYTVFLEADGTYHADIVGVAGTWTVEGEELCVTNASGQTNCQPIMEGLSLGDSWEGENAAGMAVVLTLVERN